MRELVLRLGMAAVLLAACDGTKPGSDASTGTCANLACLKQAGNLMLGCAGGGTCILQQALTATPPSTSECYDNGVKILATMQMTLGSTGSQSTTTYQVKKNDALCFTRTYASSYSLGDGGTVYALDFALQDAAGATLVTASQDVNDVVTVTCPGREPTVFTDSCGYSSMAANGMYVTLGSTPPTCTAGTCSF